MTISLTAPQAATLPLKLSASGSIVPWQEAVIGSETQGLRLVELHADVGDRVRHGQLLAVFSSDAIQADIAQARAALGEAEVALQSASQDADRARAVQASGALSAQQVSQMLNAESAARARVQTVQAQLAAQRVRLAQTRVVAPDAGIISARTAALGALGGGDLFRLIRKGRLEWRAELTAAELPRIAVGTPARVQASGGTPIQGKVRLIAPTVDTQTRNAMVLVDLGSPANLRPGVFARGDFELGHSAGVTVPQSAVVQRDGFAYVYVVGPDNRALQTKVQVGRTVGERSEVLTQLPAGARVVANGAGFLNDGDLVRVVP